jgi:hypothetical protein
MSKIRIGSLALLALLLGQTPVDAQNAGAKAWSFAAELPVSYGYSSWKGVDSAGTASGVLAFLHSPWMIGVGVENYTVDTSGTGSGPFQQSTVGRGHFSASFSFTDLLLTFPMGLGSFTVGYGTGKVTLDKSTVMYTGGGGGPSTSVFTADKSANASQVLIAVGGALSPRWEFRGSVHSVTTDSVALLDTGVPTGSNISYGGTLVALGLAYKL